MLTSVKASQFVVLSVEFSGSVCCTKTTPAVKITATNEILQKKRKKSP